MYRVRVKIEEDDDGKPIRRKMLQLWFAHREQLDAAARFCSDWLLVIDGTFNTNRERLPLLIAVGVLLGGGLRVNQFTEALFSAKPAAPIFAIEQKLTSQIALDLKTRAAMRDRNRSRGST